MSVCWSVTLRSFSRNSLCAVLYPSRRNYWYSLKKLMCIQWKGLISGINLSHMERTALVLWRHLLRGNAKSKAVCILILEDVQHMVYLLWYCQMVFHVLLIKISDICISNSLCCTNKEVFLGLFPPESPPTTRNVAHAHLISPREWTKQRRIREREIRDVNQILVHG